MDDQKTTLQALKTIVADFVKERHWQEFHTAKNLSMAIAVEAAELMELFQWLENKADIEKEVSVNKQAVEDELADILAYVLSFSLTYNIDLSSALSHKMDKNRKKYSLDAVKTGKKQNSYEKYQAFKKAKQKFKKQ